MVPTPPLGRRCICLIFLLLCKAVLLAFAILFVTFLTIGRHVKNRRTQRVKLSIKSQLLIVLLSKLGKKKPVPSVL